jgi:hypothetical protein
MDATHPWVFERRLLATISQRFDSTAWHFYCVALVWSLEYVVAPPLDAAALYLPSLLSVVVAGTTARLP